MLRTFPDIMMIIKLSFSRGLFSRGPDRLINEFLELYTLLLKTKSFLRPMYHRKNNINCIFGYITNKSCRSGKVGFLFPHFFISQNSHYFLLLFKLPKKFNMLFYFIRCRCRRHKYLILVRFCSLNLFRQHSY